MSAHTPEQVREARQQCKECLERGVLPPKEIYDMLEVADIYAMAKEVAKS